MGYCTPDLREYLTLSVVNTVTESVNGIKLAVPDGWRLESGQQAGSTNTFTLNNVETGSELNINRMDMQGAIAAERLRALTNIPESIELPRVEFGEYSGFHHEYYEDGRSLMHWWLSSGNKLLIVSYTSNVNSAIEIAIIKKIISSLDSNVN